MRPAVAAFAAAAVLVVGPAAAVTCAQDTVASATLLVPYFRVSRNGVDGGAPIPPVGTNTVLAITNTASTGVIAHLTVFNKYGAPVLGFNVPLYGPDVVFFDMRRILNGDLNVNPSLQGTDKPEACNKSFGFAEAQYRRFDNPDLDDRARAVSTYPVLSAGFLASMRDSLDESDDVPSFLTARAAHIVDIDNPACGSVSDGRLAGDFSGYLTIDVVNYCTTHGPADRDSLYFVNDAIATNGWDRGSGETPNVLMGDVFYVDPTPSGANVSGDPMVSIEFDTRLATSACRWTDVASAQVPPCRTFYSRYSSYPVASGDPSATPASVPEAFRGAGDGREPLGTRYGFRYLADVANGLQSWALVWRSDLWTSNSIYPSRSVSLCEWLADCHSSDINTCRGWGGWDRVHDLLLSVRNNDGDLVQNGCPSLCQTLPDPYVYLESQRITLAGNADIGLNDPKFRGGWIDLDLRGFPSTAQAWVGIQHSAPGQLISVGHDATLLSKPVECVPALFAPASIP